MISSLQVLYECHKILRELISSRSLYVPKLILFDEQVGLRKQKKLKFGFFQNGGRIKDGVSKFEKF
jgi:hypothetical protein